MTLTLTLPMVVFLISLLLGWTGFLLGAIKWLLNRQLIGLETRVGSAESKASEASGEVTKHKASVSSDLSQHKEAVATALANLRFEFSQRHVCTNHARMEESDIRLFKSFDKLHGDMREILGTVKSLANSIDLLNQHHLNGEK